MKAKIAILISSGILFLIAQNVFASLSCTVATSCPTGTVLFRMSSSTNAHAELPNQSLYPDLVCCSGITGLGNACSGTFAVVVHLSSTTNAHVEENTMSSYTENACLQVPNGSNVSVGYEQNNCNGFDTTVVSLATSTNSHVGNASSYPTKVCASASEPGLTFVVDSGAKSLNVTPGVLAATTSILSASSSNPTGFSISVARLSTPTLLLQTNNAVSIPDKTEWIAPAATTSAGTATASSTELNSLQFRVQALGTDLPNFASAWWGSDDTTANALFAGFPSTTQKIVNRSVNTTSTTTTTVLYNLSVDVNQQSGTYSGTITYTATANP